MKEKTNYNVDWLGYFVVDESSPSGLCRIKNRVGKDVAKYNVGCQQFTRKVKPHAWRLWFQGKKYLVHRIIWVMTYGSINPELVIDHLDGNPFNNQLNNLKLKTLTGNTRNQRQYKNNKTGITGVILTKGGTGSWSYTAQWREIDGSQKSKSFSLLKFGEENAKLLAISCRTEQIQRLISEGADYTERHGLAET